MKLIAAGDDVCPVPAPVDEVPPSDQFCDLVLTGGVASGVVYPWAIVELARAYRFRNIGGTSVGAMAATLAAAAEYGRRTGAEAPFEPLRRLPAALGEELSDGRTRMFSLFQAAPRGQRLMALWGRLGTGRQRTETRHAVGTASKALWAVATVYAAPLRTGALLGGLLAAVVGAGWLFGIDRLSGLGAWLGGLLVALVGSAWLLAFVLLVELGALVGLGLALWGDIKHGVIRNGLGLCKGGTLEPVDPEDPRPGLCEWLHEGIQRSAGLELTDRPLTFRDLWGAPAAPGAAATYFADEAPPQQRSINLQMLTTNVTHGRPYRLPLADETSRLYFRPEDLHDYLPPPVLAALVAAASPYAPGSSADPAPGPRTEGLLELPGADMPVLVAARLSLSFPLLFAAVPLYAIDYENPNRAARAPRRCLFTDGGVSSNFPIHLFDAALPRWPTFGLWLDRHGPDWKVDPRDVAPGNGGALRSALKNVMDRREQAVWLPEYHLQGWGDNWNRFDPAAAADDDGAAGAAPPRLTGFVWALARNALDWRDRTSFRLPHVRNRVARLLLRSGEGGLNIAMPRSQILEMADRYGTAAGRLFVERFSTQDGSEAPAWREQRWIRLHLLINGLRERLAGLGASAAFAAHSVPMRQAIKCAIDEAPLRSNDSRSNDARSSLSDAQAASLTSLLLELECLETQLDSAVGQSYRPIPAPEMRLRAAL